MCISPFETNVHTCSVACFLCVSSVYLSQSPHPRAPFRRALLRTLSFVVFVRLLTFTSPSTSVVYETVKTCVRCAPRSASTKENSSIMACNMAKSECFYERQMLVRLLTDVVFCCCRLLSHRRVPVRLIRPTESTLCIPFPLPARLRSTRTTKSGEGTAERG